MRLREGWVPGTGASVQEAVEQIPLAAPVADALALELASFVHSVRGEQAAVVSGAEGRAALALALRVTEAVGPVQATLPAV